MIYLDGKFKINPPLQGIHLGYLDRFNHIRHMKRDVLLLENLRDPLREAVGLSLGLEGAYYVAGEMMVSDYYDNPTILDSNRPPQGLPALWCCWQPTGDGEYFLWNHSDKYYNHKTWLEYLIEHFFNPWNYTLSGRIESSYYYCEYIYPNGDDEDDEDEVEVRCVEKSEIIINDDNIVIENVLGTFIDEQE